MTFNPNSVLTVQPIPGLSDEVNQIRLDTADIVANRIIPLEGASWQDDSTRKAYQSIVAEVKERKLWAPHLPLEYGGSDLGFLSHAYMNEILVWYGCTHVRSGCAKFRKPEGTGEICHPGTEEKVAGAIGAG